MNAFDVLGDPVRRRILELLAEESRSSGATVAVINSEFGISQAAVSQHLKTLRESGFASVQVDGARRIYTIETNRLREVDEWLNRFRDFWAPKLESLDAEVERGKRERSKGRARKSD